MPSGVGKNTEKLRPKMLNVGASKPEAGRGGRTPRDPLDPLVKFAKNIRLVTAPALDIGDPHL